MHRPAPVTNNQRLLQRFTFPEQTPMSVGLARLLAR